MFTFPQLKGYRLLRLLNGSTERFHFTRQPTDFVGQRLADALYLLFGRYLDAIS